MPYLCLCVVNVGFSAINNGQGNGPLLGVSDLRTVMLRLSFINASLIYRRPCARTAGPSARPELWIEVVRCYRPAWGADARWLSLLHLLPEALAAAQPLAALHRRLVLRKDPPDALLEEGRQTQGHAVDLEAEEISPPSRVYQPRIASLI